MLSDICPQWGMGQDLCHVHSGECSVGDEGGKEDLCHVHSGGRSVTHVPSGRWGRREASVPCTQRGRLSGICPQWGMGEEKRICSMYTL